MPLNPKSTQAKNIILTGESEFFDNKTVFTNFDNIGAQNGGWTVRW